MKKLSGKQVHVTTSFGLPGAETMPRCTRYFGLWHPKIAGCPFLVVFIIRIAILVGYIGDLIFESF